MGPEKIDWSSKVGVFQGSYFLKNYDYIHLKNKYRIILINLQSFNTQGKIYYLQLFCLLFLQILYLKEITV